jgi:16S rRNA (guanine527-N7)-methyltransferase
MHIDEIAELLKPFLASPLRADQLIHISMYIDILLRWNQKISLTAINDPREIVTRHFGESLFAAEQLFGPEANYAPGAGISAKAVTGPHVVDVGSGAGFPGLPMKIWAAPLQLTLIESNQKKATFLREVTRELQLGGVTVFNGRAEQFSTTAEVVTLRAVERFESILPSVARLVSPGGRIALLIGNKQLATARAALLNAQWHESKAIPESESRVVAVATL